MEGKSGEGLVFGDNVGTVYPGRGTHARIFARLNQLKCDALEYAGQVALFLEIE